MINFFPFCDSKLALWISLISPKLCVNIIKFKISSKLLLARNVRTDYLRLRLSTYKFFKKCTQNQFGSESSTRCINFDREPAINNDWTGAKLSQQCGVPLERGQTDARCSDTILTSAIPVPIRPVKVIESEIIEVWRQRVEGASWNKIEEGKKRRRKRKRKEGWTLARNLWTMDEEGMGGDESSVEKWLVSGR